MYVNKRVYVGLLFVRQHVSGLKNMDDSMAKKNKGDYLLQ